MWAFEAVFKTKNVWERTKNYVLQIVCGKFKFQTNKNKPEIIFKLIQEMYSYLVKKITYAWKIEFRKNVDCSEETRIFSIDR